MSLKFCNQWLEADAPLEQLELNSLYDNMKHVIWVVLVSVRCGNDYVRRVATGVSVDQHGFIITSSFQLEIADRIEVRGFENDTFIPAQRVGLVGDKCGLALLKINQECDFAKIGASTNLVAGRDVYAISHVLQVYKFTLMSGKLVSTPRKKDQVGIQIEGLSEFLNEKLDREVQLLQICGFDSHFNNVRRMEGLGAPIFNSKGQVIGVIIASDRGFDYAVPSSYLQKIGKTIRRQVMHIGGERGETSKRVQ